MSHSTELQESQMTLPEFISTATLKSLTKLGGRRVVAVPFASVPLNLRISPVISHMNRAGATNSSTSAWCRFVDLALRVPTNWFLGLKPAQISFLTFNKTKANWELWLILKYILSAGNRQFLYFRKAFQKLRQGSTSLGWAKGILMRSNSELEIMSVQREKYDEGNMARTPKMWHLCYK